MAPKGKAADKGKGKGKDTTDDKASGKQQKGAQVSFHTPPTTVQETNC